MTTTPKIQEEAPAAPRTLIPMNVTGAKRKQLRSTTVWPTTALYIDRPIDQGGYGSYAADGREFLAVDASLVRSILSHHERDTRGRAWPLISPAKVTICGADDEHVILVMLNGRQRCKGVDYVNQIMAWIYDLWLQLDRDRIKLKNALISYIASAKNEDDDNHASLPPRARDLAFLEPEDVEYLVGGRVNGEAVPGLLTKGKDTDEGPVEFCLRVEYTEIDPNTVDALELSVAERINVETPPLVQAQQIRRLLEADRSPESVARNIGCHPKTLQNRLLILRVEPEVQQAVNDKIVSWHTLEKMFFVRTKTGKMPLSREDQLRVPATFASIKTKHAAAAERRQMMEGSGLGQGQPSETTAAPAGATAPAPAAPKPAHGVPGIAGTAPTGAPPAAAPRPVQHRREPSGAGILALLPRSAAAVRDRAAALPEPSEEDDAQAYVQKRTTRAVVQAVAAVMAYLGGDADALAGAPPEVRDAVTEALAEARADVDAEAADARHKDQFNRGQTPTQITGKLVIELFAEWEETPDDARGEWPVLDEDSPEADAVRAALSRIQAAYGEALVKGEVGSSVDDKMEFAQSWVLEIFLKQ